MRELRLVPDEKQCGIWIEFENTDNEARVFAKQIRDVLTELDFPVEFSSPGITFLEDVASADMQNAKNSWPAARRRLVQAGSGCNLRPAVVDR